LLPYRCPKNKEEQTNLLFLHVIAAVTDTCLLDVYVKVINMIVPYTHLTPLFLIIRVITEQYSCLVELRLSEDDDELTRG
jgi:hypothetical protein